MEKHQKSFFPPKYRGKVLEGEVAEAAEEIIRNLSLEKKALPKKHRFPQLREWCPGHLWAPSCYHASVGHDWEVVERYISGQKSYEKVDIVSVIAEEDENLEHTKPGTHRFITNYLEGSIKNKKLKSFYIPVTYL